jgi:hypothetical protein
MTTDTKPAPNKDQDAPATPRPRFLDAPEPRHVPLSRERSDEDARLAAEIEKLR